MFKEFYLPIKINRIKICFLTFSVNIISLPRLPNQLENKEVIVIMIHSQVWWLIPIIPATWEAEIRRIMIQGQPRKTLARPPPPQQIIHA
jgi:hypothetical protein